uniref:Uncharacterized protein n=1 Tax=Oryza glumipatula TaxID=40148 RepID=A0A0D9YJT3_9ORYZ
MCPAVWVGSAQAEVQRRRLSWCCARKAATHHPPSVPSHGLKQYFFLQRAYACKSCRCKKATGQETKRCKLCH